VDLLGRLGFYGAVGGDAEADVAPMTTANDVCTKGADDADPIQSLSVSHNNGEITFAMETR